MPLSSRALAVAPPLLPVIPVSRIMSLSFTVAYVQVINSPVIILAGPEASAGRYCTAKIYGGLVSGIFVHFRPELSESPNLIHFFRSNSTVEPLAAPSAHPYIRPEADRDASRLKIWDRRVDAFHGSAHHEIA